MRVLNMLKPKKSYPTRINIGCGQDYREGYLNIDVDPASKADLLIKNNDLSELPRNHFELTVAHDILEHIPRAYMMGALLDWAAITRMNGILVLQTSSILGVAELMKRNDNFEFQYNWSSCLFGNQVHAGDFHHNGFTERTLKVYLEAAGFDVPGFTLNDGWLFYVEAPKLRDWTALLSSTARMSEAEFVATAYREMLGREMDEAGHSQIGRDRYKILRGITASPENLYRTATRLGL
jgi:hypothetical protein